MTSVCHYCGGPPIDPIPARSLRAMGPSGRFGYRAACRVCFEMADLADEGETLALLVSLEPPLPEPGRGLLRTHQREDLTGRRFGKWTVVANSIRDRADGRVEWQWRVRCDCGAESQVSGGKLTSGHSAGCKACAARINGARTRMLTKYPVSLSALARQAGVSYQAIRARILKGWPTERLATPPARRAA